MSPFGLFTTASFRIRRKDGGQEYQTVQSDQRFLGSLPDHPHFEEVDRVLVEKVASVDSATGKRVEADSVRKVKDVAKCFRFTGEADSDSHGGMIRLEVGDYLVKDGDSYFVIPDVDRRTRKPVFSERFERI